MRGMERLVEQVEDREQQVGGAVSVGRVPLDLEQRVVDYLIERVRRLAARERDDLRPIQRVLVRHPEEQRDAAAAVAEFERTRGRQRVLRAGLEPLRVGHRKRAVPEAAGEPELALVLDDVGDRRSERLLGEVPVRQLRELGVGERGLGGDAVQAEVGRVGDQHREQPGHEVRHPPSRAAGVHEVLGEPDPPLDLDQRVDEIDQRDPLLDLVSKPGDLRRQPQPVRPVRDHLA